MKTEGENQVYKNYDSTFWRSTLRQVYTTIPSYAYRVVYSIAWFIANDISRNCQRQEVLSRA